MSEKNTPEEIDFINQSSLKTAINKTKRKQTIKYFLITSFTTVFLLTIIYFGSQQILENRAVDDKSMKYGLIQGANIVPTDETPEFNLFNVTLEKTYRKDMGDRYILWDIQKNTIPLLGEKKNTHIIENEMQKFSDKDNRYININQLNGEREIEFYFPQLKYSYLPNELVKVREIETNKVVEVALSFKQPLSLQEASDTLGTENVKWLWVDTTSKSEINQYKKDARMIEKENRAITQGDKKAYGFEPMDSDFEVGGKYFLNIVEDLGLKEIANTINGESSPTVKDIRISGAVVVGTPTELERFNNLDIIRTSLIGATIDLY